jgi:riboflavin synthase
MFTGIIEECGKVQYIKSNRIAIECGIVIEDVKLGDSIAVNGVCLTVVEILTQGFVADVSPETLKVTSLSGLQIGSSVNLERAVKAGGRFGGHIVTGHIDGKAKIISITKNKEFYQLRLELQQEQARYIVNKGSVTVDGISLTVAEAKGNVVNLAIIPHTYENTNLKSLSVGCNVNIEVDILAKYVEKFLSSSDNKSRLTLAFLQEHGF